MKFEIEIPENLIQERLDRLVNIKEFGTNFNLSRIIDTAVQACVNDKIKETLTGELPEVTKAFIAEEIDKACRKKIPGWTNRRIKEMLEAVRLAQLE